MNAIADKPQIKIFTHKLANNISTLLRMHGITENELAKALNIPYNTVRRLTTGSTTDPRISTLNIIANYFNVGLDELIETNNQTSPGLNWLPVFDASKSLTGKMDIKGFAEKNDKTHHEDAIGLTVDQSFSCKTLNIGSIVIITKKHTAKNGSAVLYKQNNMHKIAIWSNNKVAPLDDILTSSSIDQVTILGVLLKIETEFKTAESFIKKKIEVIGKVNLLDLFSGTICAC